MKLKQVKDFNDYFVDDLGNVYSTKSGQLQKLKPWFDSKGRYLMVSLSNDGKTTKKLVHRLVAEAFLYCDDNSLVVDHIDGNPQNNTLSNLRWVSVQQNIIYSYRTLSQYRNCRCCSMFLDGKFIKHFRSIEEACVYANKTYNVSQTSLSKYHKSGGVELKFLF